MILSKAYAGLQAVRKTNNFAVVESGYCAAGATFPEGFPIHPKTGAKRQWLSASALIVPNGEKLYCDIRLDAIDEQGNLIKGRKTGFDKPVNARAHNIGGVLNGRKDDGTLEDGFYYLFIAGFGATDERNLVDPKNTTMYLSKYAIGYGVGSDDTRGGRGVFDIPNDARYIRQHPCVFMVQNNVIVPFIAIGESHTVENRYQFAEYEDYKSGRLGGVQFDEKGAKSYDHNLAQAPKGDIEVSLDDKGYSELHYSFFDVIPQTHKSMELQLEYEGTGRIYSSVSARKSQLVAVANGGEGVTRFWSNTGSDAAGRGVKLTIEGDIKIKRFYMLASRSQQPM